MKNELFALSLLGLLSACGGGSDGEGNKVAVEPPHCSEASVAVIEKHSRYDKNYFTTNECNELFQLTIRHSGTYTEEQSPYGYVNYKLNNGSYMSIIRGAGQTNITTWADATYSGFYEQYLGAGYGLRIDYEHRDGDDFMTKYNNDTTNTDYIYSNEDEYKLIMSYSLPDSFVADFNEATKDIKEDNVTITSK